MSRSLINRRGITSCLFSAITAFTFVLLFCAAVRLASAQDILIGATYVCSGEHIYIENCNMRDLSDNANCMVAHPDHLLPSGMNSYTYVTRGALKKLLPTCQQPSAKQAAAAQAFQKKQNDLYNANAQKANDQLNAPVTANRAQSPGTAFQPTPPKTPEERAIRRCVSSGRLPASCTGNSLLGAFSSMISSVLPGADKPHSTGPTMAGVFEGAGNWRIDFITDGVLVNCASLSPNQESYRIEFRDGRALIVINTTPKPLVLTYRPDGTIVGPGPVTINGVVASGYVPGSAGTGAVYKDSSGNLYDAAHNRVAGNENNGHTVFASRTATCPALNLTSKGASVGMETMQTDMLKSMFGGDKGPPTPPGMRMTGIFASSTGFSVQFFPESAILGCGPDVARAYPYTVVADGSRAVVKIDAPDRPLSLAFRPDGSLDPGASGSYQVHGRIVTGQDDNDDFTFSPMEQTCNLAVLAPSKTIPETGGSAPMMTASAASPGAMSGTAPASAPNNGGGSLSTPDAPLGNATLSITSGFPAQAGVPNPLAGRPYVLLRDSYGNALAKGGVAVPPGTSPYKYAGTACGTRAPDCLKISNAIKADAISAARADANGSASLPGVPPGTYYLMISTLYNKQPLIWGQAVQIKPGPNSITLNIGNATPLN